MSNDQSEPAFPVPGSEYGGTGTCFGMTLRDYFAAHAPDAPDDFGWNNGEATQCERLARWSYHYADAMLAARTA